MRPQGLAQSNTGIMLRLQMRRAFERHGAADENIGGVDFGAGEARDSSRDRSSDRPAFRPEFSSAPVRNSAPRVHLLKTNLMSKALASVASISASFAAVKPFAARLSWLIAGAFCKRAMPGRIGHDLVDFGLAIAERAQAFGHGAVDDLEIAAAGEFLEFDEREIGLDAGRVAIHHEADGAGRRDHADLRVADSRGARRASPRAPKRRGHARQAPVSGSAAWSSGTGAIDKAS